MNQNGDPRPKATEVDLWPLVKAVLGLVLLGCAVWLAVLAMIWATRYVL